jgi:protoheme IX farnesyltransferase
MKSILQLVRIKVSLMVGLSSFAGACLFYHHITIIHLYAVLSAIFLSFGCSALNQYQESSVDSIMQRTKTRPIPSGVIKPYEAVIFGFAMVAMSVIMVYLSGTYQGYILISVTILVYNLLYTPLKKKTPFALLIGSIIGAFPPVLGYTILGGNIYDSRIILIASILFLWQTPHFALLAEKYASDYILAGFKTVTSIYGSKKSNIFINVWMAAYVAALFFIPFTEIYTYLDSAVIHLYMTLLSVVAFLVTQKSLKFRFISLNISLALFFILLINDKITIFSL